MPKMTSPPLRQAAPALAGVLAAAALATAIALPAHAAPPAGPQWQCPARLTVQQTAEPVEGGWQAKGSHTSHPLVNLSFFSGPPEDQVQLVPTRERTKGRSPSATWVLERRDRPYWVACVYGGTSATAAIALPADVTSCTVEYDPNFSVPVLKQWSCQTGKP